jgi:LmbE family N-acetylglucosaminyl deacetylase
MDMKWIYLSPHLDDIAFSCGGQIWDLTNRGQSVEIWTISAGDPPDDILSPLAQALHLNWGLGLDVVQIRREEDQQACEIIGAVPRYFSYLDCIYRKTPVGEFYYSSEGDIFGGLDPREMDLIDMLSNQLLEELPKEARVVAPLGIGNHVDHELTRKAANRLGIPITFYADYPYAREVDGKQTLEFMELSNEWKFEEFPVSEVGLEKWILAARAYRSQVNTFWVNDEDLDLQIREFSGFSGRFKLWRAVGDH